MTAPLAAALLVLSACDGTPKDDVKAGPEGASSVVAPGRPGEPARTLSADEARREAPLDKPNSADFTYTEMMVVHHGQALVMTALAPSRASSEGVKQLAERIAAAQKPEIDAMKGWDTRNGAAKRPKTPHDHAAMAGMATEKQLADLKAAKGEDFDRLFLELMITHHKGALTMAGDVLSDGNDVTIEEMATDLVAQQTTEINRMARMLKGS
ncbi:DUF305 domain-containing protein [Streptomyces sp. NBC_00237]|uniref:DUF305 domain-containing protein n=1 Tax=Streptomyces sp. NBC_00237 TaxID=2975687 RepID=UPI00224CBEF4|nr:DUF305 domain-containing protein [Streptomyces sp. NBC_00237]MCX5207061.1 DUF305 domain-containing protein [Streptomyces sp. NBC_00237]